MGVAWDTEHIPARLFAIPYKTVPKRRNSPQFHEFCSLRKN